MNREYSLWKKTTKPKDILSKGKSQQIKSNNTGYILGS